MAHEIQAAAIDGAGAAFGRKPKHTLAIGAPCPNCEAPLAGPWCHSCGQSAEDFHRSLWRLTTEALGGMFEIESRLWLTLPDLFIRPARLTRRYLDGRRVAQIPPFRLFLIVVVLVFLVGGLQPQHRLTSLNLSGDINSLSFDTAHAQAAAPGRGPDAWFVSRLQAAAKDPNRFVGTMLEWAQRLAILALPISAAMLGLMFFWRRGVYLFDHLIFSMHSLSFQGLVISAVMLGGLVTDQSGWLLLVSPAHLYLHMKGTYSLGVFGTLTRMLVLFVGSFFTFLLAVVGLVLIGLYEVGG
jgi:hypothetical protein